MRISDWSSDVCSSDLHLLAGIRRQTPTCNHVERLERTLGGMTDGRGRLLISYALAKELEDIGLPDDALARLCVANAEHRRTLPYAFARAAALFHAMETAWPLQNRSAACRGKRGQDGWI